MRHLRLLLLGLAMNAQNLLATAALACIAVGCWWINPSLGLIVPASIVFCCLALTRMRGG